MTAVALHWAVISNLYHSEVTTCSLVSPLTSISLATATDFVLLIADVNTTLHEPPQLQLLQIWSGGGGGGDRLKMEQNASAHTLHGL